ncbi:MAG: acetyl-CoA C-acyltransferase, partial [Planctomycetaceae bacterium]|nr:acetyl-CoA C-acyltransferase [Planctomycetaceae bacterium]
EDLDKQAYETQMKAAQAIAEGRFDKSLVPVHDIDGNLMLDKEEFPRPQTTLEGLAGLQASFAPVADYPLDESGITYRQMLNQKYPEIDIQHMHHAGNSSGVVDGAGAILLASPDYAKAQDWTPRGRIVAMANQGDCPTLMLNAPVPAAKKVLAKAGLQISDIDLFEINEA